MTAYAAFAVFGRAIYVADGAGSVRVMVDHRSPRGPLHWRVRKLPALRVGDEVVLVDHLLRFDRGQLEIEEPWSGAQPAQSRVGTLDIRGLAARLGGRGPGLTPAGDDVLAGVLLARWGASDDAGRADLLAIARSVDTNRVARAFLESAARGQCIEPAHDLLVALLRGDEIGGANARASLASYGATSGTALATGIAGELTDADVDELCGGTPGIGPGRRVVAEEVQ